MLDLTLKHHVECLYKRLEKQMNNKEKAVELITKLGNAIVEERALELELNRLDASTNLETAEFYDDGFRKLSPEETEADIKHWNAFKNIQKIRAEIDILALELVGVDSTDKQEYLKALEEME